VKGVCWDIVESVGNVEGIRDGERRERIRIGSCVRRQRVRMKR
jgi:hypothetical protein